MAKRITPVPQTTQTAAAMTSTNGQVYTCSVCGGTGPLNQMFQVQPPRTPARD